MPVLHVEDRAQVRHITLNRPERRNALTRELIDALTFAFLSVADTDLRAVILSGSGESFCAGLDITELQFSAGKTEEEHREDAARIARLFRAVYDCDLPTIAAVQGAAVAGGTGLATLCDFTLATPDAKFGYTEARIGFVPALVSAYLAMQIGDKQARALLLRARLFDAVEAHRLGLVNEIVATEELSDRANSLAAELQRNSPESLRATKQLLRAQQCVFLDQALALGMDVNAASRQTSDFLEGVTAFLEKRKPSWQ